jgi:hypothetical protein
MTAEYYLVPEVGCWTLAASSDSGTKVSLNATFIRVLKSSRQQITPYSTFCTLLLWTWPNGTLILNVGGTKCTLFKNFPTPKTFESLDYKTGWLRFGQIWWDNRGLSCPGHWVLEENDLKVVDAATDLLLTRDYLVLDVYSLGMADYLVFDALTRQGNIMSLMLWLEVVPG